MNTQLELFPPDMHRATRGPSIPTGCVHVGEGQGAGIPIDKRVRVCGLVCAEAWALREGRLLAGETAERDERGAIVVRAFKTRHPLALVRVSNRASEITGKEC